MSEARYFWLKLQDDFFHQKSMKKLRRMERGEFCTIVYLKMQLESLRKGGVLTFEGVEDTLEEEIALQIDESVDDVRRTIDFLEKNKLLIRLSPEERYLPEVVKNTGSEGASAKRMRDLRERERGKGASNYTMSQCDGEASQSDEKVSQNGCVSQCDGEASQSYVEKKREDKRRKEQDIEEEESAPPTDTFTIEVQGMFNEMPTLPPHDSRERENEFENLRRKAMEGIRNWRHS